MIKYIKRREKNMRTTIEIDDGLLKEVMESSHSKTKKAAIVTALTEYLKMKRRKELIGMIGNYENFDLTLEDLEKMRSEE